MFHMTSWKKRCERILLILVNERKWNRTEENFRSSLIKFNFSWSVFQNSLHCENLNYSRFFFLHFFSSPKICVRIFWKHTTCVTTRHHELFIFFCQELSLSFFNLCPKMSSYSSVKKSNFLLTFHSVSHKSRYAYFRRGS